MASDTPYSCVMEFLYKRLTVPLILYLLMSFLRATLCRSRMVDWGRGMSAAPRVQLFTSMDTAWMAT